MLTRIKQRLFQQADNTQQNLKLLLSGFVCFLLGVALVSASEFLLPTSFTQELLALPGLIMMGVGCILAALGYISLSLLRLFRFFNNEPGND